MGTGLKSAGTAGESGRVLEDGRGRGALMGILDLFGRVPAWSAETVWDYVKSHAPDEVQLVDVRQPIEYAKGHLAQSRLIPLKELVGRVGELDKSKVTIVYCAVGVRGRVGTAALRRAGFRKAFNMKGGVRAWRGPVIRGAP